MSFRIESKSGKDLSATWVFVLENPCDKFTFSLSAKEAKNPLSQVSLETADGHKLFNPCTLTITGQLYKPEPTNQQTTQLFEILDE